MEVTNFNSDSQLRVSFSDDNKKMIVEGKNHEKNEIKFKDLRPVDEELAHAPKLRHNHTRIKVVNNTDGKEYRVTVKTKEFAETMSQFEGAKAKDVVKEKNISKKDKKNISGYEEAAQMEFNFRSQMEEMRNKASPEELKIFDDIENQIKEISAKLEWGREVEEKNPTKKQSGFLKKVRSKPAEKEKKTSLRSQIASTVLEKELKKMRKKASPEELKEFDEGDALVAELMKGMELETAQKEENAEHSKDVEVKHVEKKDSHKKAMKDSAHVDAINEKK